MTSLFGKCLEIQGLLLYNLRDTMQEYCHKMIDRTYDILRTIQQYHNTPSPLYFIDTFGCQMNVHDSEKAAGILNELGYSAAETAQKADLYIANTCCVREHAETRIRGLLGHLVQRKRENPNMIIVIMGCMTQQDGVGKNIFSRNKHVDIVLGSAGYLKLNDAVLRRIVSGSRVLDISDATTEVKEDVPTLRGSSHSAWISIMHGCNNFCTYCIVPYVRGRERSRDPQNIYDEIVKIAQEGCGEITLLGQNVNSYHGEYNGRSMDFPQLLEYIHDIEGLRRIRFMTSHPKDLSDGLIDKMATLPKMCSHIHLPVQSGSSEILKRMNRIYTAPQYLALVEKLKARVPDISLTTDIIVGFPGESEDDFKATLKLVEEVQYDSAFMFKYSPRKGTPAASYEDQIPDEIKQRRLEELIELQSDITLKRGERFLGRVEEVLIDRVGLHKDGSMAGKLSGNQMVNIKSDKLKVGDYVMAKIEQVKAHTLSGVLVE